MVRINNNYGFCFVLGAGLVLALAACGGDDDDDDGAKVSASVGDKKVEAGVDAKSAQLALDELTTNVDTTVTGFSSANPAVPPGAAPVADGPAINVSCDAGGAASVAGYVNIVPVPVNVDVKVAISYEGCVSRNGTKISGDLEFSQTVVAGAGTPLRIETLYSGDVTLSGAVNARCAVDLNVLVDEAGSAVQVGGSFCGQDASTLNLKIMPRWSASGSVPAR
ncbi:MAG TPA: hypothetical protein VJV78_02925 [Polyangiales bacterium]|nr:hypothetical protein [Polyangiales bacterium]